MQTVMFIYRVEYIMYGYCINMPPRNYKSINLPVSISDEIKKLIFDEPLYFHYRSVDEFCKDAVREKLQAEISRIYSLKKLSQDLSKS